MRRHVAGSDKESPPLGTLSNVMRARAGHARPRERLRRPAGTAVAVAVLVLVLAFGLVSRAGAADRRIVTIYSVASGLQYINTADDRARGRVNHPLPDSATKLWPKSTGGGGPFAGDVALYSMKLFTNKTLKRRAGTAVYTCYFNYDRHALCQAYYKLTDLSTLVASGPIDFNTNGFTIVLTGGTKRYLGVRGEVKVTPAARQAQRVDFEMVR